MSHAREQPTTRLFLLEDLEDARRTDRHGRLALQSRHFAVEHHYGRTVLVPHRNPPAGAGGPAHREILLRDPACYLVARADPDGESPWPDPWYG